MSNTDKKTNWLQLESKIRGILRDCYVKNITPQEAIDLIDDKIGEETGRGFESTKARYDELERKLLTNPLFFHEQEVKY